MKTTIFLLAVLWSCPIFSQEINDSLYSLLKQSVLNQYLTEYYPSAKDMKRVGDCYYTDLQKNPLGCVTIDLKNDWTTDLNRDDAPELFFQIKDKGLGMGSSSSIEYYKMVTLGNENPEKIYSLLGLEDQDLAKFELQKVKNNRIYATLSENIPNSNRSYDLQFYVKNDILLERTYENCPMSKVEKKIFKDNLPFNIKSKYGFDDAYNVQFNETVFVNFYDQYNASISGCEDFKISIIHSKPIAIRIGNNVEYVKKSFIYELFFLENSTVYSDLIAKVISKLKQVNDADFLEYSPGHTEITLDLGNKWKASLFYYEFENQADFELLLIKTIQENPLEYWESLDRKFGTKQKQKTLNKFIEVW